MNAFDAILREPKRLAWLDDQLCLKRLKSKWPGIKRIHTQLAIRDLLQRQIVQGLPSALVPLPLARSLAEAFESLAAGYVSHIVTPAEKKPGARTPPAVRRCQIEALAYIELAKKRHISDNTPTKTIIESFGITRQLLTLWRRTLNSEVSAVVRLRANHQPDRVVREIGSLSTAYRRWRGKPIEDVAPAQYRPRFHAIRSMRVVAR